MGTKWPTVICVKMYLMQDCKPQRTPCEMGINKLNESNAEPIYDKYYQEIVDNLVYIMTTSPDISYVVTK